jgi:hypothetical protein
MNLAKRMLTDGATLHSLCSVVMYWSTAGCVSPVRSVTACSCKLGRVDTHTYAIAPRSLYPDIEVSESQSQKLRGVNGPFPYSDDAVWEISSLLSVPRRVTGRLRDICLPPKVTERTMLYYIAATTTPPSVLLYSRASLDCTAIVMI